VACRSSRVRPIDGLAIADGSRLHVDSVAILFVVMGITAFHASAAPPRFGIVIRRPAPDVLCVMMHEPPHSLPKRAVAASVYQAIASEIILTHRLKGSYPQASDPIGSSYAANFACDPVPESTASRIGMVIMGDPYCVLPPPADMTVRLRPANECASIEGLHLTDWVGKRRIWQRVLLSGIRR
jgi:hypothetical protein